MIVTSGPSRRGQKWYVEDLAVAGMRVNLTLIPRPGSREAQATTSRYRMAATLGILMTDINHVQLRIAPLQLKNTFTSPRLLTSMIIRHLIWTVRCGAQACLAAFAPLDQLAVPCDTSSTSRSP